MQQKNASRAYLVDFRRVSQHCEDRDYRRNYGRTDDGGGANHIAANHASVGGSAGLSAYLTRHQRLDKQGQENHEL